MILICSANFVGQLKDTLVGSLSIFGVKADFLPHLHQILNYFIKCKTLPAYLSDTAQNIPEVSTQRASKEWFLQAVSDRHMQKIICSSHFFSGDFLDFSVTSRYASRKNGPFLSPWPFCANASTQARASNKAPTWSTISIIGLHGLHLSQSSSGTCLDPISLG